MATGTAAADLTVHAQRDGRAGNGLSERETAILVFERQRWKHAGSKEQAVREQCGLSSTRYYQVLNALIDRPEALAQDPMLVRRLQRMRSQRQRRRAPRRLGLV